MAGRLQENRKLQVQVDSMASTVQDNGSWLEASMLPGYNNQIKADSCGYGTASQKLEAQDRKQKGNSHTVSTSGSHSSGGRTSSGDRSVAQQSRSSASNDDSWSSGGAGSENGSSGENGSGANVSSHEEPTAAEDRTEKNEKRLIQKALRNTKARFETFEEEDSTTVEEEESTSFASIFQNGPAYSAGSAEHPKNCMPCVHYCFSKRRGCNRGDDCSFCHGFHESKLQQKRQRWKCNKKPPVKETTVKIEGGLVLMQALLEETGTETFLVPKVAYGDVKSNGGQILPPQLAYTLHPTGHLADPMTIKVPYGLQLGPAPGCGTFGNTVVLPPPGLEECDNGPESTYRYG